MNASRLEAPRFQDVDPAPVPRPRDTGTTPAVESRGKRRERIMSAINSLDRHPAGRTGIAGVDEQVIEEEEGAEDHVRD
jgi:hypothetical protein